MTTPKTGQKTGQKSRRDHPVDGVDRHHLHAGKLLGGFHEADLGGQGRTAVAERPAERQRVRRPRTKAKVELSDNTASPVLDHRGPSRCRIGVDPKGNRQRILGELVFGRDDKIVHAVESQSPSDLPVRPV